MKNRIILMLALLAFASGLQAQSPVVEVTADITTFANWTADNVYLIKGTIYVKGVLIIGPGTVIRGDKATKGTLVITRTGQINANSVLDDNPAIVFTSSEPAGSRAPGDWGGIVILGESPINAAGGTALVSAVNNASNDGQYGGINSADVSGSLQKVRIEYAGAALIGGVRLGGLTLAGVGTGTTLKNVQVTNCAGDGFDIRGGTVNMSQLLSHRNADDDFDLTHGYSGRVQFAAGLRDNGNVNGESGANGLESDNDASGSTAIPYTSATFSNLLLAGPLVTTGTSIDADFQNGIRIGGNARVGIYNSIVMGYPTGINIDGAATQAAADADAFDIRNTFVAGCLNELAASGGWDISGFFDEAGKGNVTYPANDSILLVDPFNLTFPDFKPTAVSPVLGAASFSAPALAAFTSVTYSGPFNNSLDWTLCWSNFDPSSTPYSSGSELVGGPINVNFAYDGRPSSDSLTVDFTNETDGAVRYFWNFGDITTDTDTSSLENPSWTYPEAGSYEVRLRATGVCDNQDSLSINTFVGLGLNDWFSGARLTLFPNPASQLVWLDMDLPRAESLQVLLMDMQGRVLRDFGTLDMQAGQFRYTIALDGIETGLYLLTIAGPGGFHAQKLQVNP